MIRYLTALITATLAGLAGVWLMLAPAALDYPGAEAYASVQARVSVFTGGGLCVVAVLTAVCWSAVWRSRLRAEGVLPGRAGTDPDGAVPSRSAGMPRRDAVRPKAARQKPERRKATREEIAWPAEPGRPKSAVSPEAVTGPLPPVPVPVRLGDQGLHALLAPRVAALTGDGEPPAAGAPAGAAPAATPFGDASAASRAMRRSGWRAWSVADDDAEETW